MEAAVDMENVVALGSGAQAAKKGDLAHLGSLLWYSIAEIHITREDLAEAVEEAGIDERFVPSRISLRDAFRRASSAAERAFAKKVPVGDSSTSRHANILLREVKDAGGSLVRQVVREEVDAQNVRLSYEPVAQIELSGGAVDGDPISAELLVGVTRLSPTLLPQEEDVVRRVVEGAEFERTHYDARAVRRLVSNVLREAYPVPLKNSGGLYFVSRNHPEILRSVVRLVEELKQKSENGPVHPAARGATGGTRRGSSVMSVPLVDKAEYREVLAENLDEQIEREARSLIHEMGRVIQGGKKITRRRQAEFVSRVNELKGAVTEYQELLETEISSARSNLDLAMQEAVALVSRVDLKS